MIENKSNHNASVYLERYNYLVSKYGAEKVYANIEQLSHDNKEIMYLYFGINGEKLSVKEIAEKCNRESYNVYYHLSFCLNKLEELLGEPKKVVSSSNKEKEFLEKYEKYSKQEIDNAFDKMNGLSKEIVLSYYGIGRERLRPLDISKKYEIKYHTVFNYINTGLKIFERNLNDHEKKVKISYTPKQFYSKFKEFTKEHVDEKIHEFSEKEQEILTAFYGLNDTTDTADEIIIKYNLDVPTFIEIVNVVEIKINKLLKEEKKQEERKKEFCRIFEGYNEAQINQALVKLEERSLDILKSYYGLECPVLTMEAIGKKYNLTRARIEQIIKSNLIKLKELIKPLEEKKKEMQDLFYQNFEGHSKDEIDSALLDLKKRDREIISYYYGFKEELLNIYQLSEKYHLSYYTINSLIKKKMEVISNLLENPDLKINVSKKGFYSKFSDYTKEEVNVAFRKLEHYDKRILTLYYGLEDECMTMKELAYRFNTEEHIIHYQLSKSIKKIEKNLKYPDHNNGSNQEEFYNLFRGFSTQQIKQSMLGLRRKSFDIIVMYYGLKGEAKGLDYIAKKYCSYRSVISSLIDNNINLIKKGIIENMQKCFLVDIDNSDITKIKKAMQNLNENDLRLMFLYYGLNGEDIMSKLEISEKFNVSEDVIDKKIKEIIDNIKTSLSINKR